MEEKETKKVEQAKQEEVDKKEEKKQQNNNQEKLENKKTDEKEKKQENKTQKQETVKKTKANTKGKKTEKETNKAKKISKQKETKKVKEKRPSIGKTVLKVVLVIIFIILLAVALNWTRNYFIMEDILEKMSQYENIQNYAYTISQNTGETTKLIVKDNIYKMTYTTDGIEKLIAWINKDTDETIAAFPEIKEVSYSNHIAMIENPFSTDVIQGWKDNMIYLALTSFISSENVNGQDCYVIDRFQNGKLWVNKETGIKAKAEEGSTIDNGITMPLIVEYTDWKINTITDEDVEKPDLVGYTIIE